MKTATEPMTPSSQDLDPKYRIRIVMKRIDDGKVPYPLNHAEITKAIDAAPVFKSTFQPC